MKKAATKSAFHRGFTLIELMIVIVILGILMGTILPRLSGAQGRARDTGRVADLNTIAQALELYYDDFGSYPANGSDGTPDCLPDLADYSIFSTYFKGDIVPAPSSAAETVKWGTESCAGSYMYVALNSKGSIGQAYAIVANTETATKGNLILDNNNNASVQAVETSLSLDASTTIGEVVAALNATTASDLITADTADDSGESTVYVLAN